jgi:hypothetical protein
MWFLWCANQYGSENAQNHLDSFLDSEEISAINTLWVLGVEVDQPIVLRDGYTLQSINHMPDSRDKESFLQARTKLTAPQPLGGSGGGSPIYDVLAHRSTKLPSESNALINSMLMKYEKLNILKK